MSRLPADPVTHLVAANRAENDERQQRVHIQDACGRENASRNKQGIAGEEEAYKKTSLNKNDCANQERPAPLNQALNVVEGVYKLSDGIEHGTELFRCSLRSLQGATALVTTR